MTLKEKQEIDNKYGITDYSMSEEKIENISVEEYEQMVSQFAYMRLLDLNY